ncbi:unnamed protein product [Pleuronectes platessa]|uniref:Uncharacterized protein n=1 Tax=Pleuronectes platessa TaxID=8262 RepID=A0A9N7TZ36_PLEPL|nr:unnamed protein product [Pleuronectes platessa]
MVPEWQLNNRDGNSSRRLSRCQAMSPVCICSHLPAANSSMGVTRIRTGIRFQNRRHRDWERDMARPANMRSFSIPATDTAMLPSNITLSNVDNRCGSSGCHQTVAPYILRELSGCAGC